MHIVQFLREHSISIQYEVFEFSGQDHNLMKIQSTQYLYVKEAQYSLAITLLIWKNQGTLLHLTLEQERVETDNYFSKSSLEIKGPFSLDSYSPWTDSWKTNIINDTVPFISVCRQPTPKYLILCANYCTIFWAIGFKGNQFKQGQNQTKGIAISDPKCVSL